MLRLKPISLRDANEYVRQHHRHHKPVAGHKFSIGCEADGELVGVIIAGRPTRWKVKTVQAFGLPAGSVKAKRVGFAGRASVNRRRINIPHK